MSFSCPTQRLKVEFMRFSGKAVVITGAAGGIGQALAERFGSEGAKLALVDIDQGRGRHIESALRDSGYDATFIPMDLSNWEEVDERVADMVSIVGPPEVLVNNAARILTSSLAEMDEEAFDTVFSVNVKGTLAMTRAVSSIMIARGIPGAIVNMSSISAEQGYDNLLAYSGSKGAISSITRAVSVELAAHGIRVNAVAPGSIGTPVANEIHARDPEAHNKVLSRTPLGRVGDPAEAASVVAFLASQDSSYITGQILYVDGGRLALSYTVPVP
jgi:glucose 1-dehydrogenase